MINYDQKISRTYENQAVWIMGYGSHVVPGYGSEPYISSFWNSSPCPNEEAMPSGSLHHSRRNLPRSADTKPKPVGNIFIYCIYDTILYSIVV